MAVAILLLGTIALAIKSRSLDYDVGAYVDGPLSSIYLRAEPNSNSKIVTIIQRGAPVIIKNSRVVEDSNWYLVQTENETGWLPAENINLEAP